MTQCREFSQVLQSDRAESPLEQHHTCCFEKKWQVQAAIGASLFRTQAPPMPGLGRQSQVGQSVIGWRVDGLAPSDRPACSDRKTERLTCGSDVVTTTTQTEAMDGGQHHRTNVVSVWNGSRRPKNTPKPHSNYIILYL